MRQRPEERPPARRRRSSIRRTTAADLKSIHDWLVDQDARHVPGTFFCHWAHIETAHRRGKLIAFIDGETGVPIAYQLGGLLSPGILEVRHDMRNKGIGRRFVERLFARALRRDECILYIQCEPPSSIGFWMKMGFAQFKREHDGAYFYRVLEKRHQLPPNGKSIFIAIRFYPEDNTWRKESAPVHTATPNAVRTADGVIHLDERIQFFKHPDSRDTIVEIKVDGSLKYADKAKRELAHQIGVRQCTNGFYIDRIFEPAFN